MDKLASLLGLGVLLIGAFFALSQMTDSRPELFRVTTTHPRATHLFADFGAARSEVYRLLSRAPTGATVALSARSAPGKKWRLWREWTAK